MVKIWTIMTVRCPKPVNIGVRCTRQLAHLMLREKCRREGRSIIKSQRTRMHLVGNVFYI